MPAQPPVRISVDPRALMVLERVMTAAAPLEGCALLLGTTGPSWHLRQIWPCLNAWPVASERCHRFALDLREQLLAQRWGRQRGLQVLGCAHSHPTSAPVPSATDLALTLAPTLLLIRGQDLQWRAWWHGDAGDQPFELLLSQSGDGSHPEGVGPEAGA